MDFSTVPLLALSVESKQLISTLLNPPKVLPSDNGLPRDWRGLAHAFGMAGETIPLLSSHSNPSDYILETITNTDSRKITIKDLQNALETIERWDVIDDTETLFEKDAQEHATRLKRVQESPTAVNENADPEILTIDDQYRSRLGLKKQIYDGFLLYADDDYEFAKEMITRLENENLKLCTKDRDLIGGLTLTNEAIMKLISNRCNHLIVIISPSFLESPMNTFFLEFAHAVGIDKRQRKLIACVYKECEQLPDPLSYLYNIDYRRRAYFDFWGKLCESIKPPSTDTENKVYKKITIIEDKECSVEMYDFDAKEGRSRNQLTISPEPSKCSKPCSKSHGIFSSLTRRKEKKKNNAGTSKSTSEEQVSDSSLTLPSVSSDSISLTSESISLPSESINLPLDSSNLLSVKYNKKKKPKQLQFLFARKK